MAAVNSPLPFLEIATRYREDKVDYDEYLHQLFLHCLPSFHQAIGGASELEVRAYDGFAYLIMAFHQRIGDIEDSQQLEAIFLAYRDGSIKDVIAKLDALSEETAKRMRAGLGLLALKQRDLSMLRYLIENNTYQFDYGHGHAFEDEANAVERKKEPELYKLIEVSDWRAGHRRRKPGARDGRGE